jgi:cyanophycinase
MVEPESAGNASEQIANGKKGVVMPIGGAEDRTPQGVILNRFIDLCGGQDARIMIVPTASEDGATGEDYVEVFRKIGAKSAEIAQISDRETANGDELLAQLDETTGVFITGGDQARLNKLVVGTRFADALRYRNRDGMTVAGTSAGASIIGAHMMAGGMSEAPPHKGMVEMVAGFGLLENIIIDQHFSQRGRVARLLVTFAGNPGLVAFGIDENTAVVIGGDGMAKAIGAGSVTVLDGRNVYSDYHDLEEGEILTISGSHIHVLAPGRIFDLKRRTILHLKQEQAPLVATG